MTLVKPGDLVFSFCDTLIKAVGVALGTAQTADKPEFGMAGKNWEKDGWLVPVEFSEIEAHVRPKDFIEELRPHLADKYAPLQTNGNGIQSVYLASISDGFADVLLSKIGRPVPTFAGAPTAEEKKMRKSRRRLRAGVTSDRRKNSNSLMLVAVREFSDPMSASMKRNAELQACRTCGC